MVSRGDIYKTSDKMRPKIKQHMKAFGVKNGTKERVRVRELAESIEDYDPCGSFSYRMYAAMLAAGDEDMDDMTAFNYYIGALGEFMDEPEESYEHFLETFNAIADDEIDDLNAVKKKLSSTGRSFEEHAVLQLRAAFMESNMFESMLAKLSSSIRDDLLAGVAVGNSAQRSAPKYIHSRLIDLIASIGSDPVAREIVEKVDMSCPLDSADEATGLILEFSNGEFPAEIMGLIKLAESLGGLDRDDLMDTIKRRFGGNQSEIAGEAMMYTRRIILLITGLLMLIGSGRLGLNSNKQLASAIREAVKMGTVEAEQRKTNVLKLEKQTMPENYISKN